MSETKEMRKLTKFNGNHKGVEYEIHNFVIDSTFRGLEDCWTYYLFLTVERIPDVELASQIWLDPKYDDEDRISYDYWDCWLSRLPWHGGVTYYDKISSADMRRRVIKIGCDYQHYGDEQFNYDEKWVQRDAIETIEAFLERVPDYKRHCGTVGGYWLPSEGIVSIDGQDFISFKGIEWTDENYPEEKRWWK